MATATAIDGRSRELLDERNFCHVATLGDDGRPDVALAWVEADGDDVLLNSAEGRTWAGNLRRDPRVTLTVPNKDDPYEYVSIDGRVVEMTQEGADEHIDALAAKYLGVDSYPDRKDGEVRIKIRVRPEKVSLHGG